MSARTRAMPMGRLRDPLEIINSSSRLKLKADPTIDMALIREVAERCIRHHPTLALSTWKATIKTIRVALEDIEDIYESAEQE